MPTTLSSRWTPFYKFVMPVLATAGMAVGAWQSYVHPKPKTLPPGLGALDEWMLIATIACVAGVVLWWTMSRLTRVELEDNELIISNYRTEIRVPLSAVSKISGSSMSNPKRYTLTFDEPTDLGRRISFLAPMQWSLLQRTEPQQVVELRQAWQAARSDSEQRR